MKFIKYVNLPELKAVNFHGILVNVPVWVNWLAVDSDGELMGFSTKPSYAHFCWEGDEKEHIGYMDLENTVWEHTLMEIK